VDAEREFVDVRTLSAKVEDTNLRVGYTTVESGLGVRLERDFVSFWSFEGIRKRQLEDSFLCIVESFSRWKWRPRELIVILRWRVCSNRKWSPTHLVLAVTVTSRRTTCHLE
jgi:hypothetical protein